MRRTESAPREEDSLATLRDPDDWPTSSSSDALAHAAQLGHITDDRLKLEQLHLRLRKFFSACTVLLDPYQPQTLFQDPNL